MTTIHFMDILHRGTRFSAVSAALVLLLASCVKNEKTPQSEGGDLSVASITIDGTNFTRSSFDDNSNAADGWKPNHVINGFTSGDKLLMDYTFGGSGSYAADLILGDDGGWSIGSCSFSGYSDRSHPSRPSEGESWAGSKVSIAALPLGSNGSVLSGDNHGGFNFYSVTTADDGTQVKRFYDVMTAGLQPTSETMAPKAYDVSYGTLNTDDGLPYAVFIDNSTSSKAAGSVTAKLYHANALLRVNAGSSLSVSGFKKGYSKLTGLTAAVGNDVVAFDYVSVQKNGETVNYWQAIVPAGETLTSFTPTVSTEDGLASATLAPVVLTGSSAKKLAGNNRYDITLRITPSSGDEPDLTVSITIPDLPGWDVYDETELENDKNDKDIELVTPASEDEFFGTADYYAIYTAAGLNAIGTERNHTNPDGSIVTIPNYIYANVRLMRNIDLGSICGESAGSWTPIFNNMNSDKGYCGSFDGNGKTINGLFIESEKSKYSSLFGIIGKEGIVRNLTVNGVSSGNAVSSYSGLGAGILAYRNLGTISGCKASGHLSGIGCCGGLAGKNEGLITDCQASGHANTPINSNDNLCGGFVGDNIGTITNCQASGGATGGYNCGGFVGVNNGTITNCQSTGIAAIGANVGGFAGFNKSVVSACAAFEAVRNVDGSSDCFGRFTAQNDGTIIACCSTENPEGNNIGFVCINNKGIITASYSSGNEPDNNYGFCQFIYGGAIQYCLTTLPNANIGTFTEFHSGVSAEDLNSESPASGHGFGLLNAGIKKWNSTAGEGGAPLAVTDPKYCAFHWVAGVSPFTTPQLAAGAPE